jgi:hypothetical protein
MNTGNRFLVGSGVHRFRARRNAAPWNDGLSDKHPLAKYSRAPSERWQSG